MTLQEHTEKFLGVLGDPYKGSGCDEVPLTAFIISQSDDVQIAPENISGMLLAAPKTMHPAILKSFASAARAKGIFMLCEATIMKAKKDHTTEHVDVESRDEVLLCLSEDHDEVILSTATILRKDGTVGIDAWHHEVIDKSKKHEKQFSGIMSSIFPTREEMKKADGIVKEFERGRKPDSEVEPLDLNDAVELDDSPLPETPTID